MIERMLVILGWTTIAQLKVPADSDVAKARELLERACLIANSLRGTYTLNAEISVATPTSEAVA